MRKLLITALVGLALIVVGCSSGSSYSQETLDSFAKCVNQEGAVMYGAYWCPHCKDQKKKFGESFQYINYVECDPKGPNPQPDLCNEKNIQSYPTWIFEDNTRTTGSQPLSKLASETGCSLDQNG